MKKVMIPLIAVLTLLVVNSFMVPELPKEEVRELETFNGIGIAVSADVYYTPGNTHEIRIEGDAKDVDDLRTEVRNGFLQVKYEDNWRIKRSKVRLYITSRELEGVKISGSANFECEEAISTDEMELAMSGSGGILFEKLEADEVDVRISGSGNIQILNGSADELDARISGSGKLNAERYEVSEFTAAISGSGSVRITAKEELDVKISGSGKVYYHGNPQVHSVSSGSGKTVAL